MFAVYIFRQMVVETIRGIFKQDESTGTIGVEFWVVVTMVTLLLKFAVGAIAPLYYSLRPLNNAGRAILLLNYSLVHYTLGLMQLSSSDEKPDDFFQVWAVLLVTLQYSVRIGIPYRKSKDMSLIDLLMSLWAANLIRSQTVLSLKIPLWFIWSVNALRIIAFFISSNSAFDIHTNNMRLVSNYMRYEHELGNPEDVDPATMAGYRYLVLGEGKQEMKVEPPVFKLELDVTNPDEMVTVERVWSLRGSRFLGGGGVDQDNRLKDVCLSFALYKLLRRRFGNLPIHEARQPKTKRLVFDYILQRGSKNYERAFRVTEVELRFLRDFHYSKHAIMFAKGFPGWRMLLAGSLVSAVMYLGFVVHRLSKSPDTDSKVFVTYCIIVLVVIKELWEIAIYVLSQWTKVLVLCKYVKDSRLRHPLFECALGFFCRLITNAKWNQRIGQYNILVDVLQERSVLFAYRHLKGRFLPVKIKLQGEVKSALFESFSALRNANDNDLESYFPLAFRTNQQDIVSDISWAGDELEADTHRILVWHIATCLCEINLSDQASARTIYSFGLITRPLVKKTAIIADDLWEHYIAAVTLSNHCAYLVTQSLVPDNGLVVNKVYEVVQKEASSAISGCKSMADIYRNLTRMARTPDGSEGRSIVKMGAQLAEQLRLAYGDDEQVALWRDLSRFWRGFLLHLAASTKAAKHDVHLRGPGELTTHLWALLSHAGFLGSGSHGEQMLDPADLNDVLYIPAI